MSKKRILLFYNNCDLDRQILKPVDYLAFEKDWNQQGGGNSGNKLFISAVEQYLNKEDIEYEYYTGNETEEAINEKYDMIVIPMANMFNANSSVICQLNRYTDMIERFKIPVYILGCGIQCDTYDTLDELRRLIGKPVGRFLKAIYRTGGELALRGYATKEFLDKIMPNTAVVTGCPSFYQKGNNLQISNKKVSEERFNAVINGNLKYLENIGMLNVFTQYPNSIYMDQDEFAQILYFQKAKKETNMLQLIRKKTLCGAELLVKGRIKLIYDVPVWLSYLKESNFSFSCGTRIHGNIAATLAGVPAKVIYRDARTRELAEFFELPNSAVFDKNKTLYEIYLETDYTLFNKHFTDKFERFEKFMVTHGISYNLNDRSLFEDRLKKQKWNMPEVVGSENIEEVCKKYNKYKRFFLKYEKCIKIMREFKKGLE